MGGAYAIAGEVIFTAAEGLGTYFTFKAAYEAMSGKDLETGCPLTEEETLRAAEYLVAQLAESREQRLVAKFWANSPKSNFGPKLAKRGYAQDKINEIVEAFKGGTIRTEVTGQPTKVYRYYQNPARRPGNWLTEQLYVDPVSELALPPSNNGLYVNEAQIPAGTRIFRGITAPQEYIPGCRLPGGGEQLYVPNAPKVFP